MLKTEIAGLVLIPIHSLSALRIKTLTLKDTLLPNLLLEHEKIIMLSQELTLSHTDQDDSLIQDTMSEVPENLLTPFTDTNNQTTFEDHVQKILELESSSWFDSHTIQHLEAEVSSLQAELENAAKIQIAGESNCSRQEVSEHHSPGLLQNKIWEPPASNDYGRVNQNSDSTLGGKASERKGSGVRAISVYFLVSSTAIFGLLLALSLIWICQLLQKLGQIKASLQQAENLLDIEVSIFLISF